MKHTLLRPFYACSLFIVSLVFAVQASADAYWPFNSPFCLQSQVIPWNTLPGGTSGDTSYGIKLINQCSTALSIVEMNAKSPWEVKAIHKITLQATDGETLNGIGVTGAWNTPFNQLSSSKTFPYLAGTFQLYSQGTIVPRSPIVTPPWVTGDSYHMADYDPTLYWSAATLNSGDWLALNIATDNPGNISVTLADAADTVSRGNLTFAQSLTDLGLPTGAKVYVDLDFSKTAFAFLGVYHWDVFAHPTLQLPVSSVTNGTIQLTYTIETSQVATTPKGFAWKNYVPAKTTKTGVLDLTESGLNFPTVDPFTADTRGVKLQGIIGVPFKEGGVMDGTNDDLSKLNTKLTGVVAAFANVQADGTIDVEPMHKTAAQTTAFQQNYQQYQNAQHILLISFGGEAGGAGAEHIVSWGLAALDLLSTTPCATVAACDAILAGATGPDGESLTDVINASADFYETVINRYKPDGIDLDIEGDDVTQLGSALTARVIARVMVDVQAENPNFILGLTVGAFQDAFSHLQYNVFQAFVDKGITPNYINGMYMALPLANWAALPHCVHFTQMPATPDGACMLDTINAYKAIYATYWGISNTIIPGVTPMTLHDPSSTVEIWPLNTSGHTDQLGDMLSTIQAAQAAETIGPVLFAFWDTRNDFTGGSPEKSYTPNAYQNELADYSSSAFVDMAISWPHSNLAAIALSESAGSATWSENAVDTIAGANLTYTVSINNGGHLASQSAGTAQFDQLQEGTVYTVTVTVSDDQQSPTVVRSAQFKTPTSGTPEIVWDNDNLDAVATSQTTGKASWSENATDVFFPDETPVYKVTINNSGVVQSQTAGQAIFGNLQANTTYTVSVTASDNQPSTPVTKTTTFKTPGSQPTPGAVIIWSAPQLVANATSQTTGLATWSETATDTMATAKLSYAVTIDQDGVVQQQTTGRGVFTELAPSTTYNVTVTVTDDQGSTPVSYSTSFKTSSTQPTNLAAPTRYTWSPKAGGIGEFTFNSATGGTPPYTYLVTVSSTADPQPQSDLVYWIDKMTYYKPYTVIITVIDAKGNSMNSKKFTIVDTN